MSTITLEANSTPEDDYDLTAKLVSGTVYNISLEATQTTYTGTSTTLPETLTTTTITYQTTISALIYRSAGCLGLSETSKTKDYRYEVRRSNMASLSMVLIIPHPCHKV